MLISYVEPMGCKSKRWADEEGKRILGKLRERDGTRMEIRKGMQLQCSKICKIILQWEQLICHD